MLSDVLHEDIESLLGYYILRLAKLECLTADELRKSWIRYLTSLEGEFKQILIVQVRCAFRTQPLEYLAEILLFFSC